MTTPKINIEEILNSPSTSYWLKNAIKQSLERDIVDALDDAESLTVILSQHFEKILEEAKQ